MIRFCEFKLGYKEVTMATTGHHKNKKMKDILIVFEEKDSKEWTNFIKDCFTDCPQSLSIELLDLSTNIDEISNLVPSFAMVLVVISNEMLKTMESKASVLSTCLQRHACVSVIKLYLEQVKFSINFRKTYKSCDSWKEYVIGTDSSEEYVQTIISQIINDLEKVKAPPPHPNTKKPSLIHYISPENVRQVCII